VCASFGDRGWVVGGDIVAEANAAGVDVSWADDATAHGVDNVAGARVAGAKVSAGVDVVADEIAAGDAVYFADTIPL